LSKWFRSSSVSESFSSFSQEQEDFELGESPCTLMSADMPRFSILSNDSGIERDWPSSFDFSPSSSLDNPSISSPWEQSPVSPSDQDSSRLLRRGGIKLKPTAKDSMVLMQDTLEDHANAAGGGSAARGGRRGATLQRRAGANMMENHFPKQQRYFTAKIVIMGDDRVLGRLAKAYYFYR
ncbi:hypothetical protein GOODEAATRI_000542, partial [Goodea atripinnis]